MRYKAPNVCYLKNCQGCGRRFRRRLHRRGYIRLGKFFRVGYHFRLGKSLLRFGGQGGLVESPEQWRWSSFRFYLYGEPGLVKLNDTDILLMRVRERTA